MSSRDPREEGSREFEGRLRAILESAVDGIITIDEAGAIQSFNPAAERLFGYSEAEVIGRNVSTLMPSPYRDEHDRYLASYLATGDARIIGIGREVVARRKSGDLFPIHLSVGEARLGNRRIFTGIIHNLTARKTLELEVVTDPLPNWTMDRTDQTAPLRSPYHECCTTEEIDMRAACFFVIVLALGASAPAREIPGSQDAAQIPNYRLVRPTLATAGQPSPEALARIGAQGFRTVINLRTAGEGAKEEEKTVTAQGLRYVWVPVSPETFSLADVEKIEAILDDPDAAPVLFHCSSANRVGAVWTIAQVRKGRRFEESEAEGLAIGLKSVEMRAAVRRVLGLSPSPQP